MDKSERLNIVACDCGNSSVRVMLGSFDGRQISIKTVTSEPNNMILIGDYQYWDILRVFATLKEGLKKAISMAGRIDAMGICTWGVDFSLFDRDGFMLGNPLSYRNTIGAQVLGKIGDEERRQIFTETGILCDKINSVYMLKGMQGKMPGLFSAADKLLMIPDILNYFFTGCMLNEPSEISTTQMLDTSTMEISSRVCRMMGISESIFCPIGKHGTFIGNLLPSLREELSIDYDIPVICVPSHDTASAVLGTPAREKQFAFISSGTWALIGAECEKPIITDEVIDANLTNEAGAFGHITLLKNSIGMYIIQRLKEEYDEERGCKSTWDEFNALAEAKPASPSLFNVNDPVFFNPPKMSDAIWQYLLKVGQVTGEINWNIIIGSLHFSMACSYAAALEDVCRVTGCDYGRVYIVGGGSRNDAINRLCADITGWEVVACTMECTSIGNVAAQLKYFHPEYSHSRIKEIVTDSLEYSTYTPEKDRSSLLNSYKKILAHSV